MTNQEFYNRLDEICLRLHQLGLDAEAARISVLLHEVAWTTTSELFPVLEAALRNVLASPSAEKLSEELKEDLAACITLLGGT
jgi:hypothetical protein